MEITNAILLRRIKLTETSWIIEWLTESCGRIKTVAKGARKPSSPFAGKLDLFFEAEIQFARSRKSELHILREVVLRQPFEGLRQLYLRASLAACFVELIEIVTEPEHPVPELFDLLKRAFTYLETAAPNERALVHFENELSRLTGIQNNAEGAVTAAIAIGRLFGRLPPGRAALLKRLRESTHNP